MIKNLKYPVNVASGTSEVIYIALAEWFKVIQKPDAEKTVITRTHEFIPGKGFLQLLAAPQKTSVKATSVGDFGFGGLTYSLESFIAGNYLEQHSLFKALLNKPLIVLAKDLGGFYYQIGNEDLQAYLTKNHNTSDTKQGNKGYSFEIITNADRITTYTGNVLISPDELNTLLALMVDDIDFLINELNETIDVE